MRWEKDKLDILLDEYEYSDLEELSKKLKCTVKALRRKAETLKLKRATNNKIIQHDVEYKYCSFCNQEHPLLDEFGNNNFHRDKHASYNFKYYCKKYDEFKKLNKLKESSPEPTTLLNQKRGNPREYHVFETEKVKNRPRNPVVFQDGIEGKICNYCKTFYPLDMYSRDPRGIRERKATCKQCYKNRYSKK